MKADEVLLNATQGIADLITRTGLINVDFADVRTVMQNGGSALMGTGIGKGENRALEAAQQAISSPLLDNISIAGATGVLINITSSDITMGEVTQISEIIHDAAGDQAEIIFGSCTEATLSGEIRVTVIATGFDRAITGEQLSKATLPGVLQFPEKKRAVAGGGPVGVAPASAPVTAPAQGPRTVTPRPGSPSRSATAQPEVSDMEIPTFIRRQMD
jgi:cell division protein FtsZ